MNQSQVLFDAGMMVLGDDHVGALAKPFINLGPSADDDELGRVTGLAMMKEFQPALQVQISVHVKGLIVPHIHSYRNLWLDMLLIESLRPIRQKLPASQTRN